MPEPFEMPRAPKDPEATRKLLAMLWERNLPVLRERCTQLEQAVVAIRAGIFTQQHRTETISTSHKLAGSLGMFGYMEATHCARRIEQQLESPTPIDALELAANIAAMRVALSL